MNSEIMKQGTINFNVYEGQKRFLGLASVDLPTIEKTVNSVLLAGMAATMEVVMPILNALTMTMHFQSVTDDAVSLLDNKSHNLTLREAIQTENGVTGEIKPSGVKHVFRVVTKTLNMGNVAPASASEVSGEYAVRYWAKYDENGNNLLEIDVKNGIFKVNGANVLEGISDFI